MGKASRMKMGRAQQPQQELGYCEHCLDTLSSAWNGPIADAMLEAYVEMRRGEDDRPHSHEEAIAWLGDEAGAMLQALRSSGERYHRDLELESKAEAWGDYSHEPETAREPEPWTQEERDEYQGVMERERLRDERRRARRCKP